MTKNRMILKRRFKIYRWPILLYFFIAWGVFSPIAGAEKEDPDFFYFVQITDTHFGSPSAPGRALKIIDSINSLPYKIDFAVLTGDIFDKKLDEKEVTEALDTLKELRIPLHFLAGNHDMLSYDAEFYTKKIGKLNYILEHKRYRLVFISSFHPTNNPMETVETWFKNQLSGNTHPVLLFHHEPFVKHCYTEEALKTWEDLLIRHKCTAILSGHLHRDGLNWFGEIPEYTSSCVVKFRGRQATYRLYKCRNRRLSYATFYVQVPYESLLGSPFQ